MRESVRGDPGPYGVDESELAVGMDLWWPSLTAKYRTRISAFPYSTARKLRASYVMLKADPIC